MAIMLVALQGPLHELSDYFLFSAHMVQHLLIMLVMPPFLLAGTPGVDAAPGGAGAGARRRSPVLLTAAGRLPAGQRDLRRLALPGPYDLMMRNHDVHKWLMHLMIMAVGVIMWWPVMSPLPELPRLARGRCRCSTCSSWASR
jgi:putative membrane protein